MANRSNKDGEILERLVPRLVESLPERERAQIAASSRRRPPRQRAHGRSNARQISNASSSIVWPRRS